MTAEIDYPPFMSSPKTNTNNGLERGATKEPPSPIIASVAIDTDGETSEDAGQDVQPSEDERAYKEGMGEKGDEDDDESTGVKEGDNGENIQETEGEGTSGESSVEEEEKPGVDGLYSHEVTAP